jgi:hypothetical protein
MRDGKWHYTIQAFSPPSKGGGLLIETLHSTKTSRDIEISVFKTRMARGEISHIRVISHVAPFGETTIFGSDALHE